MKINWASGEEFDSSSGMWSWYEARAEGADRVEAAFVYISKYFTAGANAESSLTFLTTRSFTTRYIPLGIQVSSTLLVQHQVYRWR